jgi:hypothetical protein
MEPDTESVLELAAIIREVDGSHTLGAAALAEAILAHPRSRWLPDPEPTNEGDLDGLAHEVWALAQLAPGEGIEDGVDRVIDALKGLALWGSPTPVLLSDREPTPQECDNEGRCWWFHPAERGSSHPLISKDWWVLSSYKGGELWLPYWAFPSPLIQPT